MPYCYSRKGTAYLRQHLVGYSKRFISKVKAMKNFIKTNPQKIFVILLACSISINFLYINVQAKQKTNWKKLYKQIINESEIPTNSLYKLVYINKDSIPELIIWDKELRTTSIYTAKGEKYDVTSAGYSFAYSYAKKKI